ncbi:haloacid dehalogenase [Mycena sp. CBHHK59/15]|nr:haloacid dehalogenase [Mycena sp. CBHHK59/15]
MSDSDLHDVHSLVFDVFGTVVDWHGSMVKELDALGKKHGIDGNWSQFAKIWRHGYIDHVHNIAQGGTGSLNVDELHREILENMLQSSGWNHFGNKLSKEERDTLNDAWHRLNGWPDTTEGLYALKKQTIIAALSNGNVRLLVDMAKFTDLPWDVVFSSELFSSFKPFGPEVYLGAIKHLSLQPHNCAMVAAHLWDLRGAAHVGMKTIYVRRAAEEPIDEEEVKPKSEGGEVDVIVNSFIELAALLANRK